MESWKEDLECRGTYYEGWVENVERVLTAHKKATVTCYGTRRSSRNSSSASGHSSGNDKENAAPTNEKETKVIQTLNILIHTTVQYSHDIVHTCFILL